MPSYCAYFAYGSNLSTVRLQQRVPSAQPRCTGLVNGYEVVFRKRGVDGSAKATLAVSAGNQAHGCVFMMAAREKSWLDRLEALGFGYEERSVRVIVHDGEIEAFTYIAASSHTDSQLRPYDWYAALVYAGAREHGLPISVIARYGSLKTVQDPDAARAAKHWAMLNGYDGVT